MSLPARLEYRFSFEAFDPLAKALRDDCGARLVQQLDGLDQRYWDFEVEGKTLTLHRDTFMGTSLFVVEEDAVPILASLLDRLAKIEVPFRS